MRSRSRIRRAYVSRRLLRHLRTAHRFEMRALPCGEIGAFVGPVGIKKSAFVAHGSPGGEGEAEMIADRDAVLREGYGRIVSRIRPDLPGFATFSHRRKPISAATPQPFLDETPRLHQGLEAVLEGAEWQIGPPRPTRSGVPCTRRDAGGRRPRLLRTRTRGFVSPRNSLRACCAQSLCAQLARFHATIVARKFVSRNIHRTTQVWLREKPFAQLATVRATASNECICRVNAPPNARPRAMGSPTPGVMNISYRLARPGIRGARPRCVRDSRHGRAGDRCYVRGSSSSSRRREAEFMQ